MQSQVKIDVQSTLSYTDADIQQLYADTFPTPALDNFFLSEHWIRNWLACAKLTPKLLTFRYNNDIVGFVFIGKRSSILGDHYYLNQTGNEKDDQIWIEYNDVICASHHQECRLALLEYIASQPRSYQFIGINQTTDNWLSPKWLEWSTQTMHSYKTNIDSTTPIGSHFSKNTKSQISRSVRFIEQEYGEISYAWITHSEIEGTLEQMAKLHIKQWGGHSFGSGFSNKRFVDFHRNIMTQGIGQTAHVAKYTAGDQLLGYLYYFTFGTTVYFYLSAINYANHNNKYKPGLVMHKLAMEDFMHQGFSSYDFLAGKARYKTSLSNQEYLLYNVKIYSNKWYYAPIMVAVRVKRYLMAKALRK